MYICVCNAVTERDIHDAITRGAASVRELRDELGIVDTCGRCATCALECLTRLSGTGCDSAGHCASDCHVM